jgi:hypothetical protein
VNSKQEIINSDQEWVDVKLEMLNHVSEGRVDENDEKDGRKMMQENSRLSHHFAIINQFYDKEEAYRGYVTKNQRLP